MVRLYPSKRDSTSDVFPLRQSTGPKSPPGRRFRSWRLLARLLTAVGVRGERTDERQVPVALGVVKTVADHELISDLETGVGDLDLHLGCRLFAQQNADGDRGRIARLQVVYQVGQGQAGVDDVLDHQHMAAADVDVEILEYPHHPGGRG